jgi:hypothetical protein
MLHQAGQFALAAANATLRIYKDRVHINSSSSIKALAIHEQLFAGFRMARQLKTSS